MLQYGALDLGLGVTNAGLFDAWSTSTGSWLASESIRNSGRDASCWPCRTVGSSGLVLPSSSRGDDRATLPYLGGRTSISLLIGPSRRLALGWWLSAGSTTTRAAVNPTVETCFVSCGSSIETHTIGGPSHSTGLRFGAYLH